MTGRKPLDDPERDQFGLCARCEQTALSCAVPSRQPDPAGQQPLHRCLARPRRLSPLRLPPRYRPRRVRIEDWEIWLKLAKKYKFVYIDKVVALYRWHSGNACQIMRFELVRDGIKLLEREREYAIANGYENIFYLSLVDLIVQLRHYNLLMFVKKIVQYSTYIKFTYFLLLKVIKNRGFHCIFKKRIVYHIF